MLAWPWDAQNLCPEVNPWGCLESSLRGFFPMLFWNHFPMICEETNCLKTSSLSMILWGSWISSCLLLTVMPKLWGFPWRTVEMCPIFDKIPYILNLMSEQLHHLLAPTETSSFLRVLSLLKSIQWCSFCSYSSLPSSGWGVCSPWYSVVYPN